MVIRVETIHFYKRYGLIAYPPEPQAWYRHYDDRITDQLKLIAEAKAKAKAKAIGFTPKEIDSLMRLDGHCADVAPIAIQKLHLIRA
ncbi:hypothetical protein OPS25_04385 [Alteromonas ponticola]|uniref:MerR family transcriptional regulator n=1 Tax=Alteromonas aquimaris TaxID=2998417 RepID=A0ABT3P4Q2_9ALTE|nr:hypothetical protein [Alteromonas aquimaris]MCW8107741.1 hypothetical protein [Alteromonas aquimaris]